MTLPVHIETKAGTAANICNTSTTTTSKISAYQVFQQLLGVRHVNPGQSSGLSSIIHKLKRLGLNSQSRVIDIGGGTGHAAVTIARRYQCHVTVLEIDEKNIEQGRRYVQMCGLSDRVSFVHGDLEDLVVRSELLLPRYDAVVWLSVISFVQDRPRMVELLWQLVAPGGMLVGLEFIWKFFEPHDAADTYNVCGCQGMVFYTTEDWLQMLTDATGETAIRVTRGPFNMMTTGMLNSEGFNLVPIMLRFVWHFRRHGKRIIEVYLHFLRRSPILGWAAFELQKSATVLS